MQKRIDLILELIKEHGYVTVKYLCEKLHYSTATINRDLNDLQKQKLIVRHYGGAEIVEEKGTPLVFRYHKMRPVKRVLAKKGAELVKTSMTLFIDGTTTTHCMGEYLSKIENLTVITNNMNLASHLSEKGVNVIVLGGKIIEPPDMTGGIDAETVAKSYTADLFFFSTGGVSSDGKIFDNDTYINLRKIMIDNSQKSVLLLDHQKIITRGRRMLCDLSGIDIIITDYIFSSEVKNKFPNTTFIEVPTPLTQKE